MRHQVARKKERNIPNEPQRDLPGISQTERSSLSDVTSLQRAVGNQGLMNFVQTKLAENQPTTDRRVQRAAATDGGFNVDQQFTNSLSTTKNTGSALPDTVKQELEPKFGQDFSAVRIHTDNKAAELSRSIQAKAFTHGNDIYFGEGQYSPTSSSGKHLLAHELTHTVQQTGGAQRVVDNEAQVQPKLKVGGANDRYEQEADRVADQVMRMPIKENGQVTNASHDIQRVTEDKVREGKEAQNSNHPLDKVIYKDDFYAYAKKEYSEENIDCVKQIQAYKSNPSRETAIAIFDNFIQTETINISGPACNAIRKIIEGYRGQEGEQANLEADAQIFKTVESELKKNISDTYMRFCKDQKEQEEQRKQEKKRKEEQVNKAIDSDVFYAYAKKEYSEENIDCIKQIRMYKSKPRRSVAIAIFDNFITKGVVNVSGKNVKDIKDTIEEYRGQKAGQSKLNKMKRGLSSIFKDDHQQAGNPELFKAIEMDLRTNISDTYTRFILTPEGKAYS